MSPHTTPSRPSGSHAGLMSGSTPAKPVAVTDPTGLIPSASTSGTNTPGRLSTRSRSTTSASVSRKGKERAADEASINSVDIEGELVTSQGDGLAAKGLRELVRRSTGLGGATASGSEASKGEGSSRARATALRDEIPSLEATSSHDTIYHPRKYYVLTHAGKLVFSTESEGSSEEINNLMGIAQALISIYAEDDDRLRYIVRGRYRISFVLKAPLYLFCVSDWGEPEHVLRTQLEYIHLQILSVISSTQLSRTFQRRSNFDLSRLLEGTENFLHALIKRSQYDFSYLTSSLEPLRMSPSLRDIAAAALMPPSKFKDLLYVLLIAEGHIVTLLRPRKHSIHPSDLHLLLNTLATSSTLRSSETWIPICFPKFNPAGFVHAYISPVSEDITLVFVSADREAFEELQSWKDIVLEKLEKDQTLSKIQQSIPAHPYSVSALSCPGLRHFIYKSRHNVQITAPIWEGLYAQPGRERNRGYSLITLYQRLHDALHARSGQPTPLNLVYVKTDDEACLAWKTKPFELYITVSPHLSKAAVVGAANTVAKWVGAEEAKLFIKDAPVF